MLPDCYHINPLQHGGSSQEKRLLPELKPESAPIDNRTLSDLILFVEQYAELLNFYDSNNKLNGDWKSFLSNDITTILSAITVVDYNLPVKTYYKYNDKFDTATLAEAKQFLKILFDISFTLLDAVRKWNERLLLKSSAKDMIYREISSHLSYSMRDLILYYNAARDPAHVLVDVNFIGTPSTEAFHFENTNDILTHNFKPEWIVKYNSLDIVNDWNNYVNTYLNTPLRLAEAKKIFGDVGWNDINEIRYSLSFQKNVFTSIYNSYVRIITNAKKYFKESIDNYPYHKPNNGLMLAFLRLFGNAQQALNTFTDRHLDFYYKDVLQIKKKAAIADAAHVVFTLAKNVDEFTIEKGEKLFAGKDAKGIDLIYATDTTTSLNKSEVAGLKSIFFDGDTSTGGIFAAEIANSKDGNGKELEKDHPSWFPFGESQQSLAEKTMTEADVGFMIAAPILQLSEAKRTITLQIATSANTLAANALQSQLDIWITGKKDWIKCPEVNSIDLTTDNAVKIETARITIRFTLQASEDGVVPFNEKTHKANYSTEWPVVKILLKKDADPALYKALSKITVQQINIKVEVTDAQLAVLNSDAGTIENKNPFMPFGPRPKKDFQFYFGSYEAFSKKIISLTLQLNWLGLPTSSFYNHYSYKNDTTTENYIGLANSATKSFGFNAFVLDNGIDNSQTANSNSLFAMNDNDTPVSLNSLTFTNLLSDSDPKMDSFNAYSPELRRGFLKIKLTSPAAAFGHDAYAKTFTQQVIKVNDDASKYSLPNEPYTPLLQPLKYNYAAEELVSIASDYDKIKGQFFHLFPFGYRELNNNSSTTKLVTPFIHSENATDIELQGALFVGIKNIKRNEQLTLYIEFDEGSEDSSIDPSGIYWSYLKNNDWAPLKNFLLSDTTNGMLGSGIITINIPEDMNDDNTLMPSGVKWIRAGVENNYTAYPKALAVYTNAIKATFNDNGNDPNHLASPLVAGKIKKMFHANAAIKKIEQPFDSFDNRMIEAGYQYYTRVSERLRHKNRAITIWDYEKLTLEQFNFLYKTKCLNHTSDDTELAPGHVRMIVVPDISKKSTGNLFQPSVSNNTREKIRKYLSELNCAFVDLKVENPKYEAVLVKCQVRFRDDLLFDEWRIKLSEDIDKFLAPWAFTEGRGIDFGGRIHRSHIINYIEKLKYVDYLTDVTLDLYEGNTRTQFEVDEVNASTSKSILTSKRNHDIGPNVCMNI